ncbi:MAG: tRNA glutamyl-Q(34) synthetase GluQRS [Gammaproteobacteria bacterium]|nr:tRNA glutamyl-Q(34) synthetase GluQRS [Gammaproteobacteria bacterium]
MTESYIGRFAPSPTGPLHFGSLVAALASFLDARHHQGQWLLRMEDLDSYRVSLQSSADIQRTLDHFGLHWDGEMMIQSDRDRAYEVALQKLMEHHLVYPCVCSRKQVEDIYQGTCRNRQLSDLQEDYAIRVMTDSRVVELNDRILGYHQWQLARDLGDFIVKRKDGLFAYQLAVVIDDASQGVNQVVRGADLLDSTPWQIYLQQLLDLPTPTYAHIPVILNPSGDKLSKQTGAQALDLKNPVILLKKALILLGQTPPPVELDTCLDDWLAWAVTHWNIRLIPGVFELSSD